MEKKDGHKGRVMRTSIGTVTEVSIKLSGKEERKQKGGWEYRTKHKTCSARNTGKKTGREESIHTRHRLIENRQTDKEGA